VMQAAAQKGQLCASIDEFEAAVCLHNSELSTGRVLARYFGRMSRVAIVSFQ
jgi:hypothetical protein